MNWFKKFMESSTEVKIQKNPLQSQYHKRDGWGIHRPYSSRIQRAASSNFGRYPRPRSDQLPEAQIGNVGFRLFWSVEA